MSVRGAAPAADQSRPFSHLQGRLSARRLFHSARRAGLGDDGVGDVGLAEGPQGEPFRSAAPRIKLSSFWIWHALVHRRHAREGATDPDVQGIAPAWRSEARLSTWISRDVPGLPEDRDQEVTMWTL